MLNNGTTSCEFLSDMCLGGLEESNFSLALVLEVLMFGYAFIGLAIVCDDYLVMSLEQVRFYFFFYSQTGTLFIIFLFVLGLLTGCK